MTHDSISDLITRIRNAQTAKKIVCEVASSNIKLRIVKLLKLEGYILNYKLITDNKQNVIKIALRYRDDGRGVINEIERISKCSLRRYTSYKDLGKWNGGIGRVILSTPKGIMTDKLALENKVGGELLFKIW